jgi:Skp family chaperone for outer membrane proteins
VKYGEKNGYTAILDSKNGVIYHDPAIDVSDIIIKELNKSMGK